MRKKHYSFPLYVSRGFDFTPDGTFAATGVALKTFTVDSVAAATGGGAYYAIGTGDLSALIAGQAAVPTGFTDASNNGVADPAFTILEVDVAGKRIKISNPLAVKDSAGGSIQIHAAKANGIEKDQRSAMLAAFELPTGKGTSRLTDIQLTACGVHNIDLQDTREDVVECFICQSSHAPLGLWLEGSKQTSLNVWCSGVLTRFAPGADLGGATLVRRDGAVSQPDQYPTGAGMYVQSAGPRSEYNATTFARWANRLGVISVVPFSSTESRLSSVEFSASAPNVLIFLAITGNTEDATIQRAAGRISFNLEY